MNRTLFFILLLCLFPICCFSQLKATFEVIDSLRMRNLIDKKYQKQILKYRTHSSETVYAPPPPSLKKYKQKSDYSCKRRYKIPIDQLTALYPFDADSIVVSIPDNCYWQRGGEKIAGRMSQKDISRFVDILYNFGYKKIEKEDLAISTHTICGCGLPVPDVRLYFYHHGESRYLDMFTQGFIDSFANTNPYKDYFDDEIFYNDQNGIYWGGECNEAYSKIIAFIEKTFKCKLKFGRYEESSGCSHIEIMKLEEHKLSLE